MLFNSSNIYPMYLLYMVYILLNYSIYAGFPGSPDGKESACNVGDLGLIPGLGRFPWRRERLPTPVFWPGEFHRLYSPWGHKESDMTERLPRPLHFMQM